MADNMNDQFEHGRIPLKPLSLKNKNLASTCELIVDYEGENPTYRIYISDKDNVNILHDLTKLISEEIIKSDISMDPKRFKIDIEGVDEPEDIEYLMNFIYKRFVYPDNINGFRYDRDIDKVLDDTAKNTLLTSVDGTALLPVTTIDNVIDKSGMTITDRLGNMVSTVVSTVEISPETDRAEYDVILPYSGYDEFVEVHINSSLLRDDDYTFVVDTDDNNIGILTITDHNTVSNFNDMSWIQVKFIYNAKMTGTGKYERVSGFNIANYTIPTNKLQFVSNSYRINRNDTVATSAGLYNLYTYLEDRIATLSDNEIWAVDSSVDPHSININTDKEFVVGSDPFILNVALSNSKTSDVCVNINTTQNVADPDNQSEDGESITVDTVTISNAYDLMYPDGSKLTRGIAANRVVRLLMMNDTYTAIIISSGLNAPKVNRYIHNCVDQETVISYNALDYNTGDIINVYRNGIRLFEDLDYFIDTVNETITLFVRTEKDERIIFEALS